MDTYMSAKELAKRLGLSMATLARWRRDGRGPRWLQCSERCIRYRASDVEAWEQAKSEGEVRDDD